MDGDPNLGNADGNQGKEEDGVVSNVLGGRDGAGRGGLDDADAGRKDRDTTTD